MPRNDTHSSEYNHESEAAASTGSIVNLHKNEHTTLKMSRGDLSRRGRRRGSEGYKMVGESNLRRGRRKVVRAAVENAEATAAYSAKIYMNMSKLGEHGEEDSVASTVTETEVTETVDDECIPVIAVTPSDRATPDEDERFEDTIFRMSWTVKKTETQVEDCSPRRGAPKVLEYRRKQRGLSEPPTDRIRRARQELPAVLYWL